MTRCVSISKPSWKVWSKHTQGIDLAMCPSHMIWAEEGRRLCASLWEIDPLKSCFVEERNGIMWDSVAAVFELFLESAQARWVSSNISTLLLGIYFGVYSVCEISFWVARETGTGWMRGSGFRDWNAPDIYIYILYISDVLQSMYATEFFKMRIVATGSVQSTLRWTLRNDTSKGGVKSLHS